jgi:prepilin-type N-terminal cleavage/methylation domain-containing protein
MKKKILGFTLVEILVVISIISVLSGVIYANFNSARESSRDKVRQTSLKEMSLAIELYKAQFGFYPAEGCGTPTLLSTDTPSTPGVNWAGDTVWTGPGGHSETWANNVSCPQYIVGLTPEFISELAEDPSQEFEDNRGFLYQVSANGDAYKLIANGAVESASVTSYDNEFARCPRDYGMPRCDSVPQAWTYAVYSRGAEDW